MRNKLLVSFLLLTAIMLVAFFWIINISSRATLQNQMKQSFLSEIHLIEKYAQLQPWTPEGAQNFVEALQVTDDQRITIVNMGGVVLADNYEDPTVMDNHLMRPEVQQAINSGLNGVSVRYSSTIRQEAIYVAKVVLVKGESYILRVSKPFVLIKEFNRYITYNAIGAIIIVALLVWIMSFFMAKRITDPIVRLKQDVYRIAEGDYETPVYTAQTDEIGQLGDAFNIMRQNLVVTMGDLESRNAELNAILNSMVSGIIAVDGQHQIMMINQTAREILMLSDHVAGISDSMYRIIRNDEIIEMINEAIEEGEQQTEEIYHVHLEKNLRVIISPITTEENSILGAMIVFEDITNLKKLENMRSEFVSNVSHELKTPLTSIMGFVDTLKGGALKDTEKSVRFLDIIETEALRLNRLISDILLLSEIENSRSELDSSVIDVNSIAQEVIDMLQIRLEGKEVELNLSANDQYKVYGNKDRLKQIFINLVDNAIKYTEKGKIEVLLKRTDRWLEIVVSDTGIGIPEEHRSRLFERFYRVDKARSRKVGGTGLGLSIVKHIVSQCKGEIFVESALYEGSTFTVHLPLYEN